MSRFLSSALVLLLVMAGAGATPLPARAATTFVVNRIGDQPDLNLANAACDVSAASGRQCTLRAAIQEANDTPGADTINFNITSTSKVIAPASPLPPITDPVTINGYSQSGASANTLAVGNDAVLKIVLDGVNAGAGAAGLDIQAANSVVRGLVIQRFGQAGILISGGGNQVRGNFIGTDATGTAARGNTYGVHVTGPGNTVVGGTAPGGRNLISGNVWGVYIESVGRNTVQGNFIGSDRAGTAPLGNSGVGILVDDSTGNLLGGTGAGARNLISGNGDQGIFLFGDANRVEGNLIGTRADGTGDLGNGEQGVIISGAGNFVGGSVSGAANVISGNDHEGVLISGFSATGNEIRGNVVRLNGLSGVQANRGPNTISGNFIAQNGGDGIQISDDAEGVRVAANLILGNAGLGIDLVGGSENAAGVTANDTDDPDTGPNRLQNFPVLTAAVRGSNGVTVVAGTLNSMPSNQFRLELFIAATDPSGHGEGHIFVATQTITTKATGDRGFSFQVTGLQAGQQLTMTATRTTSGSTSEFSANVPVVAAP